MSEQGFVTVNCAHNVATTVERLKSVLSAKGITIFACVDHAACAAHHGLSLRATKLLLFGSPATATPLMQEQQIAGLDLPLKALIWQDAKGAVHLTYNDVHWIAERHGLGNQTRQAVDFMSTALKALVEEAIAP